MFKSDFDISKNEYGWVIKHKPSNKSMGINYKEIPEDSSIDFVLGYARCLSAVEHWR